MTAILNLIEKIRDRPGVILGRPCARTLYAFLWGFAYARKDEEPDDLKFLGAFNKWVHNRYEISSSQGWAKIVEFYSLTEADEMALFWRLFDEYVKECTSRRKKVS